MSGGSTPSGGDATPRPSHPLRSNWRQPLLTAIGMAAAVGLLALVDPRPGPLVLAAVLAMTISRNRLVTTWRGRAEAIVLLPFVGLATAGVGYLFVSLPIVGAVAYVAAMFLSIFLRRFGPFWTRVGSLIALPFITLLIAPGAGVGTTPLEVAALSVGVLVLVVMLRLLAEVTRFVARAPENPVPTGAVPAGAVPKPPVRPQPSAPAASADASAGSAAPARPTPTRPTPAPARMRPVASTRMAIQMAVALSAAFVIGWFVFPQHVSWVVLTAFIVCSGNRGRADVLYKSGLRIVGAAVGTIVASVALIWLTPSHAFLQGPALVVTLLAIVGIGLWLREWTYAAWAVVMTLVITLLQGVAIPVPGGPGDVQAADVQAGSLQLWIRILAIIVGAACGLLASWFVLPVRSEGVMRRRVADALATMSEYAAAPGELTGHDLGAALDRLNEVAAPWHALERVTAWRKTTRKPGQWTDLVHECASLVRARPKLSADARRALTEARRSMREPEAIGEKLLALRDELQADR